MARVLERALPAAARAFSTSAAVQAAPAVATAKRSFLAQLFGSGSRVDVPLTDPLPGVEIPAHIPASPEAPTTQLTKLSNGATIATENTPVRAAPALPSACRGVPDRWGARSGPPAHTG